MSTTTSTLPTSKGLHVALWIVQVILGLMFVMAGLFKIATPSAELVAAGMTWIEHSPGFAPPLIGALEFLGGLGLILPSALRIQPKLTPIAAACLSLTMVAAAGVHISIGEAAMIAPNIVLGALAVFVAWGRWSKSPIQAR